LEICLCHLWRRRQDSEGIGREIEIRLGIAELPAGYPLDLKVALRARRQLDGRCLRSGEANGLYRKAVGSRREIAEEDLDSKCPTTQSPHVGSELRANRRK
jgi:hypothetical protein